MMSDGSMRVEVSLSEELASQVAQGAQLVVHHANGRATLEIIPVASSASSASDRSVLVHLPQHLLPAAVNGAMGAKEEEVQNAEEAGGDAGSDEAMIAALVGCAAEKASFEAAHHHLPEEPLPHMSDEALALALAGCVRSEAEPDAGHSPHQHSQHQPESNGLHPLHELYVPEWYEDEEGAQELDMSLFEQEA